MIKKLQKPAAQISVITVGTFQSDMYSFCELQYADPYNNIMITAVKKINRSTALAVTVTFSNTDFRFQFFRHKRFVQLAHHCQTEYPTYQSFRYPVV